MDIAHYINITCWFSALLSFIPGIVNLAVFFFIILRLPQKPLNVVFSLFVFSLFIFQMSDTLVRLSLSAVTARAWLLALGSWVAMAVAFGVHLSLLFSKKTKLNSWVYLSIYFPAAVFTTMHMIGFSEVNFIENNAWGFMPVMQPTIFNHVYAIWISAMGLFMLAVFIVFAVKIAKKGQQSLEYKQAILIVTGIGIPIIQGIVTEIMFPLVFDVNPVPLISASVTIFSVCAFVALTRYQLLSYSTEDISSDILDKMNEGVMIVDNSDTIQSVNQKFCTITGYTEKELIGKNATGLFLDETDKSFMANQLQKRKKSLSHRYELKMRQKSGNCCWVEITGVPYIYDGKVQGSVGIHTDITAQKLTENKLKEIEKELNFSDAILDNVNNYVLAADSNGEIIYASNSITTQLGYEKQEVLGKGWYSIMRPEESVAEESSPDYVRGRAVGREMLFPAYENWIIDKQGNRKCILWQDTKSHGDVLIGIGTDITSKKNMENKMLDAISETQENEQKRIARELHDGLIQVLTSVKINLNVVESRINLNHEHFDKAQELLNRAITDARSLSHDLMPIDLGEYGLIGAIEKIKDRMCVTDSLKFHFEKPPVKIRLSQFIETNLYRIAQEFINNTFKYAEAKNINVSLVKDKKKLWLELKDDGKGFKMKQKNQEGIGIKNMRARVAAINGQINIHSFPGKGVSATISIPIEKDGHSAGAINNNPMQYSYGI